MIYLIYLSYNKCETFRAHISRSTQNEGVSEPPLEELWNGSNGMLCRPTIAADWL